MDQQIRLIERVRRTLPTGSTYAVAKALETSQTDLSRVLKGRHGLGLKSMVRVAEILQMDLKDVIVLCQEDVAKRPADKEFWSRRSPRITASIAIAILAFGLAVNSKDAQSHNWINTQLHITDLYIMRSHEAIIYLTKVSQS